MTSKARQKIDPSIRDMFDAEVDRPDHDKLLMTLFSDEAALHALLTELHDAKPLPPFTPESKFRVIDYYGGKSGVISYAEAVERTGVKPSWVDSSPIRLELKRLEQPLEYSSGDTGRYARIVGFADIVLAYTVVGWPDVVEPHHRQFVWGKNEKKHCAVIEVKSAWPTVGNLVRQLQLYRFSDPVGISERQRANVVVGPDGSMNEVLCEHHYRLVTFDQAGQSFQLLKNVAPTVRKAQPGQF